MLFLFVFICKLYIIILCYFFEVCNLNFLYFVGEYNFGENECLIISIEYAR